jgi:hypothetical protein
VGQEGFGAKKNREWDRREYAEIWRKQWARSQNRAYERKGLEVRVSHESYAMQGIDREPTKYLQRWDFELERRGRRTERGDENRTIKARNREREARERELERERKRTRGRSYE